MKALSVDQPWASLIARGEKTIEIRKWTTTYRGPLLIVSTKLPHETLPLGQALCICNLVDCRPMTKADEVAACRPGYPGAMAWVLGRVIGIEPFDVTGRQRIYEVDISGRESLLSAFTEEHDAADVSTM